MILYAAYLLLFPGFLPGLFLSHSVAAPTSYDQRQDGKYNVHAKLENFLIVVATSGGSDLWSNLAFQALDLKELASQARISKQDSKEPHQSVIYETDEEHQGKEPYHVEIVHIDKDDEDPAKTLQVDVSKTPRIEEETVKIDEGVLSKDAVDSKKITDAGTVANDSDDNAKTDKKARSLSQYEDTRKLTENVNKQRNHKVLVDVFNSGTVKHFEQSRGDFADKEDILKTGKPGISLKKQLSRKEIEDSISTRDEKNDVGPSENKPEELKLLGESIENCGPGRYRDKSGICQFDKNIH